MKSRTKVEEMGPVYRRVFQSNFFALLNTNVRAYAQLCLMLFFACLGYEFGMASQSTVDILSLLKILYAIGEF